MSLLVIVSLLLVTPATANILMPHSIFSTRSMGLVQQSPNYPGVDASAANGLDDSSKNYQQHNRNCFFTPVQCMLPLTDSHKDVQSLHGVYTPTATNVRRNVDSMLTSPWGYTDLIKRGGDNRFYQWLSRF